MGNLFNEIDISGKKQSHKWSKIPNGYVRVRHRWKGSRSSSTSYSVSFGRSNSQLIISMNLRFARLLTNEYTGETLIVLSREEEGDKCHSISTNCEMACVYNKELSSHLMSLFGVSTENNETFDIPIRFGKKKFEDKLVIVIDYVKE